MRPLLTCLLVVGALTATAAGAVYGPSRLRSSVATSADLPACAAASEGDIRPALNTDILWRCESSAWVATAASVLATNGANCSAGQYPLGVDAAGAVESCTAAAAPLLAAYLAADGTNATATLATTGLSITVAGATKYSFKCVFYVSDSVAAEGVQIAFDGGGAGETNFRAQVTGFDSALALSTQLDDLTDVASVATFTGNGALEVHGAFEPSGAGTFIPRYAQATHALGTLTLYRGSHCLMWVTP